MAQDRRAKAKAIALPATVPAWPSAAPALFALLAATPGVRFGAEGAGAGLLIAALATFVVYLPVIGVLAGGRAEDADDGLPDVPLTRKSLSALLALWTGTAWAAAAVLAP